MKDFKVTMTMPAQRVVDLFISACEGGSNYWCKKLTPLGNGDPYEAMLNGFVLIDAEGGNRTHTVQPEAIQRALDLFPKEAPRHFSDWLSENDDAETADVFLQLCVFGKTIYG